MRKWIKRVAKGALVLLLVGGSFAGVMFLRWRNEIVDHLEDSRGPVEYTTFGEGRPVLYLHGSPGGFDQVYGEAGPGFRAIIPSRPGYLQDIEKAGQRVRLLGGRCAGAQRGPMDLGTFSISLAVKDLEASRAFYGKFGFKVFAGERRAG